MPVDVTSATRTEILLSEEGRGITAALRTWTNAMAEALEHDDAVGAWNGALNVLVWSDILAKRLRLRVDAEALGHDRAQGPGA